MFHVKHQQTKSREVCYKKLYVSRETYLFFVFYCQQAV